MCSSSFLYCTCTENLLNQARASFTTSQALVLLCTWACSFLFSQVGTGEHNSCHLGFLRWGWAGFWAFLYVWKRSYYYFFGVSHRCLGSGFLGLSVTFRVISVHVIKY